MKISKKLTAALAFSLCVFGVITLESCYTDSEEALYGTTPTPVCDATKFQFAAVVKPILSSKCATSSCHSTTAQAAGIKLSTYAEVKNFSTQSKDLFLCAIKHAGNCSQMPKNGSKLPECEIASIENWIKAGMPDN
jgi:hypothetical protein